MSDDQQLLDSLAPDPLLGSDIFALDDATFKTQLADIVSSGNGLPDLAACIESQPKQLQSTQSTSEHRSKNQIICNILLICRF